MRARELARALQRMPADYVVLVSTADRVLVLADPALTADTRNGYVYLELRAQLPTEADPAPLTLWERIRLACGF